MGLWSKIKKGAKKAWKGVKKGVKAVARTVKKVAKKVAYATPWGKKAWDFSSKVGKKAKKGVMKVMKKLGPVGIIAIQVVLSATGIGAGIAAAMGSLWASMGAAAAAAAQAGSILGTVANAAFNAVNWVGGTLGAVGDALAKGASELMAGNFSNAATQFGTNMVNALTGKAGDAAVQAGIESAAMSAAKSAAGQSVWSQAAEAGSNALANSGGALSSMGESSPQQSGMINTDAPTGFQTDQVTNAVSSEASPAVNAADSLAKEAGINTTNVGTGSFDPNAGFDASKMFQSEQLTTAQTTAQATPVTTFNAAETVAESAQPSLLDSAYDAAKDFAQNEGKDIAKDYIKQQSKSLLSRKAEGEPAAGYPADVSGVDPFATYDALRDAYKSRAITAQQIDFGAVYSQPSY